ncbi:DUF438 domain-containing protein [Chloroflexota bacterium]
MNDKDKKKDVMKDIILKLHGGLAVQEAKDRFEKEVGNISSSEIAEIEQSLIDDGLSPDEIKQFCNVHTLLFKSALDQASSEETSESHPIYLFRLENREIEKLVESLKDISGKRERVDVSQFKSDIKGVLKDLTGINVHYERKEQLLFPFLDKQGFTGPSKVMWGKDNEIRNLMNKAAEDIGAIEGQDGIKIYLEKNLYPLLDEISGMIFKEENILFPTAIEKLSASDWVEILQESNDVGYVFIEKQQPTEDLIRSLRTTFLEEPIFQDNEISFPVGNLRLEELMNILNTLPVDLTFVDKDDTVRYFTAGKERVFTRTRSVIGRKVQNCHPPQSIDVVEKILASFKQGKRDSYDFWIILKGRTVYIRYFAVRDQNGSYLGTVEVTQDITDIKKLEGENRLINERD